jgi:hypothetical protein
MPSEEDITSQQNLLESHRFTLAHYLKQQARFGASYVPPAVVHDIREARENIRRIKTTLRDWGVHVDDHPDDELQEEEVLVVLPKPAHGRRYTTKLPQIIVIVGCTLILLTALTIFIVPALFPQLRTSFPLLLTITPDTPTPVRITTLAEPPLVVCPKSIEFGETIECEINPETDTKSLQFEGKANDRVAVRMSRTTGRLLPQFIVYSPDGNEVCGSVISEWGVNGADCKLPADGNYKIDTYSLRKESTGRYRLYVQSLNNPGRATSIALGGSVTGAIEPKTDSDTYIFIGKANDKVSIRMSTTSGNMVSPQFGVYGSDGLNVCSSGPGQNRVNEALCTLPDHGQYAIITWSRDYSTSGSYTLELNPG